MECMWKTKSKSEKLQQSRDLKKKKRHERGKDGKQMHIIL